MTSRQRGGAPVGHLADLDAVGAGAVMYLRMWADGSVARARVCDDFRRALPPAQAGHAVQSMEQMMELCAGYARRPIMRHDVMCSCLGADEACFANLVGAAAEGNREDAMLLATLMVRPDAAPGLTALAERVGLAIQRMATLPPDMMEHRPERLH
ncbi:MAG: hypothetical protein CML02_19145 [Pseudooceanicola sp.]|nr:hypothetical protein [Pseudooceanicola sp.]